MYPKFVAHSTVCNTLEDVFFANEPLGQNTVVLYDQTHIPLEEDLFERWANNKCIIGLQRVCAGPCIRLSTHAVCAGPYMENVELYSISLRINQPLYLRGNIVLRNCAITITHPMYVRAGTTLEIEQCTIGTNRESGSHRELHTALNIGHNAQSVILRKNVWSDMNRILQIYPYSEYCEFPREYPGNDAHIKRCGLQCDSTLRVLECTDNVMYRLTGKQAFLGCPTNYCHHINCDHVRVIKGNRIDRVDQAEQNIIYTVNRLVGIVKGNRIDRMDQAEQNCEPSE
ncbi:MAG: hypothetical protein HRU26_08070 [Psychroserpens sp.]|nr:hypothetical protein [Psychroserpens sp.]